jgi:hypothetical protein
MAGLMGIGRKKKAYADDAGAKSAQLKHLMAKSRAELMAREDAEQSNSAGTVAGAVAPFAIDKGMEYAGEEGLMGSNSAATTVTPKDAAPVGQNGHITPTGEEFVPTSDIAMNQAVPKDVVGGAIPKSVPVPGAPVPVPGASLMPMPAVAGGETIAAGGGAGLGASGQAAGTQALNGALTTEVGKQAVTQSAAPAGASVGASAAGSLGVGLAGTAGAIGGKMLVSDVIGSDDKVAQGAGSVGGGALAGAAAGSVVPGIGTAIGAAIGGIAGLLGAF